MVLELVDLGVERVDEIEVGLRGGVDEPVDEETRRERSVDVLEAGEVGDVPVRRRLPDGDDDLGGRDDVELVVHDPVVPAEAAGEEEDAQHVGAVRLERRSGVPPVAGDRAQGLDRLGVEARRHERDEIVRATGRRGRSCVAQTRLRA